MTRQNISRAYPVIGEKAIGGLRVCPVLTDQWNALSLIASHLRQQLAKSSLKTLIRKLTA
jgi:hypothetical protein